MGVATYGIPAYGPWSLSRPLVSTAGRVSPNAPMVASMAENAPEFASVLFGDGSEPKPATRHCRMPSHPGPRHSRRSNPRTPHWARHPGGHVRVGQVHVVHFHPGALLGDAFGERIGARERHHHAVHVGGRQEG